MSEENEEKKVSLADGHEDVIKDLTEESEEEQTEEGEELSEVEALEAEIDDLKDKLMRALAEGENVRKRAVRDRIEAEQRGGRRLARDMLSVYDNMNRAMEAADDETREAAKGLIEGLDLTMRELVTTFEKHEILPIAPKEGDKFDPQFHEAMFEAALPNTKKGDIIQVLNEGFTIAGSLVRPAQVGVSSGG